MTKVAVEEAQEQLTRNHKRVTVIDARNAEEWNNADIKGGGAIRITPDDVAEHISDLSRDDYILVYCT